MLIDPVGRPAFLCIAALALSLAACDRAEHGTIRGEAFLAEDMDAEQDLARLSLRLIMEPDRDTANLDSTLANICRQRDRYIAESLGEPEGRETLRTDSLGQLGRDADARGWRARDRLLQPLVRMTARTDDRSRFAIDSIEPGDYRLWADTIIDGRHWSWLRPVEVEAGDSIQLNLSNGNSDENPFRCIPS